jgi:hypothetical protein
MSIVLLWGGRGKVLVIARGLPAGLVFIPIENMLKTIVHEDSANDTFNVERKSFVLIFQGLDLSLWLGAGIILRRLIHRL